MHLFQAIVWVCSWVSTSFESYGSPPPHFVDCQLESAFVSYISQARLELIMGQISFCWALGCKQIPAEHQPLRQFYLTRPVSYQEGSDCDMLSDYFIFPSLRSREIPLARKLVVFSTPFLILTFPRRGRGLPQCGSPVIQYWFLILP